MQSQPLASNDSCKLMAIHTGFVLDTIKSYSYSYSFHAVDDLPPPFADLCMDFVNAWDQAIICRSHKRTSTYLLPLKPLWPPGVRLCEASPASWLQAQSLWEALRAEHVEITACFHELFRILNVGPATRQLHLQVWWKIVLAMQNHHIRRAQYLYQCYSPVRHHIHRSSAVRAYLSREAQPQVQCFLPGPSTFWHCTRYFCSLSSSINKASWHFVPTSELGSWSRGTMMSNRSWSHQESGWKQKLRAWPRPCQFQSCSPSRHNW